MQKSVLVEIVRSLSRKEIREIQKWLQSPAHNQRQDVIWLFDYLVKNPIQGDQSFAKEQVWSAIFPNQVYDDAFMRQVMYFLLKSLEDYLLFTDLVSDRVKCQLTLARVHRQRKLEKSYRQAYRSGLEGIEIQPLRNNYYLLNKFFIEQEEHEQRISTNQNSQVNLQEMNDALEKWFVAEKMRIAYSMLAHRTVYQKANYETGLLSDIIPYIGNNNLVKEPAIAAYYYAYMASTHSDEESYFDVFEDLISNNISNFDRSEVRTLYQAALNYCVGKANRGFNNFAGRLFDLYRKGLETGILLENDIVSRYTFGNAVGAALKIRQFQWAEKFIEDFQHYLEEKQRHSIVNFNLSRVYFEKGDYNKAQQLLTQFEYDDMLLNIIAKTMLLKIYYEQDELDAFESLLESMRIYLQRKEALDPARKTSYKNMLSLMKKLMHLNPYSKAQKEKLRELIVATNPLMERDWLLRQLGDK